MSGTNSTTEEPQEQQNREDGGDKAVVANDTSQAPNSTTDAAKVTKYRALMTYSGTEDRKITFRKDDPLTVLEKGADGELTFPSITVRV